MTGFRRAFSGLAVLAAWATIAAAQTPNLTADLVQAAIDSDTAKAEKLLAAGVDPNSADAAGLTALNWSAYEGGAPIVRALLTRHATVDSRGNANGWTPLMNAANNGHDDVITLLLDAGAQIDIKDKVGRPAIWYAAQAGKTSTVALLKSRGATADVSRIAMARVLCAAAKAPMGDDKVVWALVEGHPDQATCGATKHVTPSGSDGIIMFTYTATGDDFGAKRLSIHVLIADHQLNKTQVAATLAPLLNGQFAAAGRGPVPPAVLSAAASLSSLRTDTPLGQLTAIFKSGTEAKFPANGSTYDITVELK